MDFIMEQKASKTLNYYYIKNISFFSDQSIISAAAPPERHLEKIVKSLRTRDEFQTAFTLFLKKDLERILW